MEIIHHGAQDGVTGSCHQLLLDRNNSLLIDCGLFQGAEISADGQHSSDNPGITFDIRTIKALVATHVHIDHVGRIPFLLAAGYKGPILCSLPSATLLLLVLEDAFRLGISRDEKQLDGYLKTIEARIVGLPYDTWLNVLDTPQLRTRVRLQRAGHILGSAYVEYEIQQPLQGSRKRIVFSGDLGAPYSPLLPAPKLPYYADTLALESTYGDRAYESRTNRRRCLQAVRARHLTNLYLDLQLYWGAEAPRRLGQGPQPTAVHQHAHRRLPRAAPGHGPTLQPECSTVQRDRCQRHVQRRPDSQPLQGHAQCHGHNVVPAHSA